MKRTDITALLPEIGQEALDKIMELNGADINAAKSVTEDLRTQLAAAQAENAQLKAAPSADSEKLAAVQKELAELKAANAVRDLRAKISKDTGVPADLLTGDTEDACKKQADAIKAYAKPSGYPAVRDGGEVHGTGGTATREKFADWFNENMK